MRKYIENNFLPKDHDEAEGELTCYKHCKKMSDQFMQLNRLDKAAAYSENATRSLNVLVELKKEHDKSWFANKQIEAEQVVKNQLASVYE